MKVLLLGMLFVYLDLNLDLGGHILDVLPDFVGYLLMARGLSGLRRESGSFARALPVTQAMTACSGVLYVLEFVAGTVQDRFVNYCLGLAAVATGLLIGFWLVSGIRDLERTRGVDLEGEKLRSLWMYSAVVQCIASLCGWLPLVGSVCAMGAFVMNLCFLAAFYRSENLFEVKK